MSLNVFKCCSTSFFYSGSFILKVRYFCHFQFLKKKNFACTIQSEQKGILQDFAREIDIAGREVTNRTPLAYAGGISVSLCHQLYFLQTEI